jgi:putative toxin-antitoxin system antitoxin component (TIGR02293 family)
MTAPVKLPSKSLPERGAQSITYAEVLKKATAVLGSPELAESWMIKPARGLDGRRPVDLIENQDERSLISDFLMRMEYGVY